MSTLELMDSDKEKGVIGPTPQEAEELNRLTGPVGKSRFSNIFRGVAAVLGLSAGTVACNTNPQPAEVRPVQTQTSELVSLESKIQVTYEKSPDGSTATATKAPESTSTPTPTETPSPTPTPEAKPLPEVISNETVKFVTLPPEEVQKMIGAAGHETFKIPLPSIVKETEVTVISITHSKTGSGGIAIVAPPSKEYAIPALLGGKIQALGVGSLSNFSGINISTNSMGEIGYFMPSSTQSSLKVGQNIDAGQPDIITIKHAPNSQHGQLFLNFLRTSFPNAPENTLMIIGHQKGAQPLSMDFSNILTTPQGEIVLVGSSTYTQ